MSKYLLAACAATSLAAAVAIGGCGGRSVVGAPAQTSSDSSHGLLVNIDGLEASQDSSTIRQMHVRTWDFLGGSLGTHQVTWAQAAPYLTWAMTGSADSVAIRAVGIKTAVYTNPNRQGPMDPLYTSDEATFAHDCSGKRMYTSYKQDHALMDVGSAHLASLWQGYVQQITIGWGGAFDAVYDDQADNVQYATSQPCKFDWNAWTTASNNLNKSLGIPIIYNALSLFSGYAKTLGVSPSIGLNASTIGGEAEACYTAYIGTQQPPHMYEWLAYENTEIAMYRSGRLFLCGGSNHKPADQAIPERTYQEASFLLTYNRYTSMLSEHFETASHFHVEPESELVALRPLLPEPTDISSLQVSPGIYAREYRACYIQGKFVGRCATVVNPENLGVYKPFPWPTKYHHTLLLTGGGVLDGGTIATNGPPPPANLNGEQAVIVFN